MLPLESIAMLLRDKIGLEISTIGQPALESALRDRIEARRAPDPAGYAALLRREPAEQQALVERVVVPETWFFREAAAFKMLGKWALGKVRLPLRVLSVPCSTGEEPYSVAMALLGLGIKPRIEAIDISARAIQAARAGLYTRNSFRGEDLAFRDRFFSARGDGTYLLGQPVKDCVRFEEGNVLALNPALRGGAFDLVFCRNLTIYMTEAGRRKALAGLRSLLRPDGLFFAGHAEFQIMADNGFVRHGEHRAFAFVPRPEPGPPDSRGGPPAVFELP